MREDLRPGNPFPDFSLPDQTREGSILEHIDERVASGAHLQPWQLLTEGSPPVGRLRRAPASGPGGELLQYRDRHYGTEGTSESGDFIYQTC